MSKMTKQELIAAIQKQEVRASGIEKIQQGQVAKLVPGFKFNAVGTYDEATLQKVYDTLLKIQGPPLF